jgi:hypothetical protein
VPTPEPGWTLADAVTWLDPKPTVKQLELLVRANGIRPSGTRKPRPGSPGGRPAPVYPIDVLIDLHAANVRWIVEGEAHDGARSLRGQSPACRTRNGSP